MIRNLKVLIAAAMALAAFGGFSASAHAAEELFHCSADPCTVTLLPDGEVGTTNAHQVLVLKGKTAGGAEASASFTCNRLDGSATFGGKTTKELTFTNLRLTNSLGEEKCKIGASETIKIDFNSCHYLFTSTGGATDKAEVHLLCTTVGDGIAFTINGTECLRFTPTTATGIGYSTVGTSPNRTVTATVNAAIPNAALDLKNVGTPNCAALGLASTTGATFTTGFTTVTGETDSATPIMEDAWFA
jgi:hypothetical protein